MLLCFEDVLIPLQTVDGGAWRTQSGRSGLGFKYPDFLLAGTKVAGVAGLKKSKL